MMKTLIFLLMVTFGLGVDASGGSWMEVATGLAFFFGAVGLAQPVIRFGSAFMASRLPVRSTVARKVRH